MDRHLDICIDAGINIEGTNAEVAAVSNVPIMMDESIYDVADITRAAKIKGCGFVKLKLSKLTGIEHLAAGLRYIIELGMTPVMGNGAAPDISCWVEACVALHLINNAGENCGFLKTQAQLLADPLTFKNGAIILQPNYKPQLNHQVLERYMVKKESYSVLKV